MQRGRPGKRTGALRRRLAGDFARRVIRAQPLDYLRAVAHDYLRSFALRPRREPGELPLWRWQFQLNYPLYFPGEATFIAQRGGERPHVDLPLARFLRGYQRIAATPGPLFALGLLAGLLAALGLGRARRSGLRSAAFLFAAMGFVVFASVVATNQFGWRYQVPMLVLLPPAAAIGLTALIRRPAADASPDEESEAPAGPPPSSNGFLPY